MPREFPRSRRIEEQIQRILSDIVRSDARDPMLAGAIVTTVRVSGDLSVAWVHYSMLDPTQSAEQLAGAFDRAAGFLRGRLARELQIRKVPELRFVFDDTGQRGADLEQLIDSAVAHDQAKSNETPDTDAECDDVS